jgi:hypothetical protein
LGEKELSLFWWIILAYLVWAAAGVCRAISLLGHKNHKDTLLDKILITGVMPIAYIMGAITFIRGKLSK